MMGVPGVRRGQPILQRRQPPPSLRTDLQHPIGNVAYNPAMHVALHIRVHA